MIFSARRIITMAGDDPEAFAVVAGKVVATGTRVDLSDRFPHDEQVDFRDAVIIPGFNDAHMHLAMTAEDFFNGQSRTVDRIKDRLGSPLTGARS